jgi:hypothetical protein
MGSANCQANVSPSKLLIFVTLLGLIVFSIFTALKFPVNADSLYCLSLVNDLLFGRTPFHWITTPANSFVPDTLIVFIGRVLGFDGQSNFVFFAVIFVLMLFLSLTVLLRACNRSWNSALIGSVLTATIFGFSGSYVSYVVAVPGIHAGVLPIISASFALIAALTDKVWSNGLTSVRLRAFAMPCILIGVAVASDAIAYVQLVAPAIAAAVAILWRFREPTQRSRLTVFIAVGVVGCGALLGYALWKVVNIGNLIHQPKLEDFTNVNTKAILFALKMFLSSFPLTPSYTGQIQFWLLIAGGILSSIVVFVTVSLPSKRFRQITLRVGIDTPSRMFCVVAIADCVLLSLAGPILVGTYVGLDLFRQQLPALLFGALLVIWLILSLLERFDSENKSRTKMRVVTIGAVSWLLLLVPFAATTYTQIIDGSFPLPYLEAYKRVAGTLKDDHLNFVLTGYWDAKPLIEASGSMLDVCPISANLDPLLWIMNLDWCSKLYRDWSARKAPLVVLLKSSERDDFFKQNGRPSSVLEFHDLASPEAAIYKWNPHLDMALKAGVCSAFSKYAEMPRPSFCSR